MALNDLIVCLWSCSNSTEWPQTSCWYTTQAAEHGSKAPQDIMMRNNRYDVNFVFAKGSSLQIADTFNRAHLVESNQDDRARNMNIYAFA